MSQQINLFNPIFLKQKKVLTAQTMAAALVMLLFGAFGFALYTKQRVASLQQEADVAATQLAEKQARQAESNARLAPRQKDPAIAARIVAAEAELRGLQQVSSVLKRGEFGNTSGYSEYFKALARQSVAGLWLTEVSISGAGIDIGVRGRALQPTLVPNYIGRLSRENIMRGKSFSTLNISQPGQEPGTETNASAAVTANSSPFVEFNLHTGVLPGGAGATAK